MDGGLWTAGLVVWGGWWGSGSAWCRFGALVLSYGWIAALETSLAAGVVRDCGGSRCVDLKAVTPSIWAGLTV
jgi:hypothetical protein